MFWEHYEYRIETSYATDMVRMGFRSSVPYNINEDYIFINIIRYTDGASQVKEYKFNLVTGKWSYWREDEWKELTKEPSFQLYIKADNTVFNDLEMICLMHNNDKETLSTMLSNGTWVFNH